MQLLLVAPCIPDTPCLPLLPPCVPPACTADGSGITYNANINIALAVAMPDGGLITPVLKNADTTDIYQLSRWERGWGRRGRGRGKAVREEGEGDGAVRTQEAAGERPDGTGGGGGAFTGC